MIKYVAAVTAVTLWLIPGPNDLRADVTSRGFAVDSTLDGPDADPGDRTCSSVAGECTLRAAVQEANELRGADTITLPSGTYALSIPGHDEDAAATGDLDITDDLTINWQAQQPRSLTLNTMTAYFT
jgi:CSLREA domain-containing protein